VRRSVEAAQASLEATQEDLHNVLVSLLAEVALNYPIQFQVDAK
jgi:outer membrane protein TolC